MNNPQTFQQELHSMSLSDLWAIVEITGTQTRPTWAKFQDAILVEIKSRIDLLKKQI